MNDDDLKNLSCWKQYLYLIHQPFNWNEDFEVCCAVAACDGSVDDFKYLARLHPNYNENDEEILSFENKKNYNNEKRCDINSLRKLAKICEADFFRHSPSELNKLLVDLNVDGLK